MNQVIRYDLQGAFYENITKEPHEVVSDLGIKIIETERVTIGDLIYMRVENVPNSLPDFITRSNHIIDPSFK